MVVFPERKSIYRDWKRFSEKSKKMLDKGRKRCYISQAPVRAAASTGLRKEKSLKKQKILLDNGNRLCYYNRADAEEAEAGCTLKIEQCKKTAYAK